MRIVCVDDEPSALARSVSLCRALAQRPAVEGFSRARDALEWLRTNAADLALLDIRLPDMDGIALAERMRALRPRIAIVFLTCHSEYALEAFRLHASGYLLKPLDPDRLAEEVGYALRGGIPPQKKTRVRVRTFGEFDVLLEGRPVVFERARARELLAFLVDRQGGFVTRANAFAALWEDGVYSRPMQKQLDVVIRSMRRTLEAHGIGDIVEMEKGLLRVVPEKLDCDLYRFLNGEPGAADAFRGEYMNAYSWASLTEAYMDRVRHPPD